MSSSASSKLKLKQANEIIPTNSPTKIRKIVFFCLTQFPYKYDYTRCLLPNKTYWKNFIKTLENLNKYPLKASDATQG